MTQRQPLRTTFHAALFAAIAALSIPAFAEPGKAATSDPAKQGADNAAAAPATQSVAPKKTWADLDVDKSGALSKTEAGAIPSLQAVFDQADANADGSLTGDEYRIYLAANGRDQSGAPAKTSQQQ